MVHADEGNHAYKRDQRFFERIEPLFTRRVFGRIRTKAEVFQRRAPSVSDREFRSDQSQEELRFGQIRIAVVVNVVYPRVNLIVVFIDVVDFIHKVFIVADRLCDRIADVRRIVGKILVIFEVADPFFACGEIVNAHVFELEQIFGAQFLGIEH